MAAIRLDMFIKSRWCRRNRGTRSGIDKKIKIADDARINGDILIYLCGNSWHDFFRNEHKHLKYIFTYNAFER